MLSRVATKNLLRGSAQLSRMIKTDTHVCFCGCTDGKHFGKSIVQNQRRNFQGHLNLDSTFEMVPREVKSSDQVSLWKDAQAK